MDNKPISLTAFGGTGGAIPVKNEKGEITMQKVKVQRYVAGKRPKYAPSSDNEQDMSDESEENEEDVQIPSRLPENEIIKLNAADDRRLKRLNNFEQDSDEQIIRDRAARHRHIAEPVVLLEEEDKNEMNDEKTEMKEESDEEEIDDEQRIKRRLELKQKALQRQEELLGIEEEQNQGSDSESDESEYEDEEYSDSEDEVAPRLKPVFVRKTDRVTIQEKEKEAEKEKQIEQEKQKMHLETKKQTRKIIEEEIAKEKLSEKQTDENIKCDFETDDENDENEYELWKLRELKRIKRDRDEKENMEKEKQETQRLRNMTEEERLNYLKLNPKIVTNQSVKGKYKFLQKYYHRGAFYMDEEEDVYKRNVAEPTLEDHFDKSILPKVMQVKNFGMAGRTKYTHLLDQDTTRMDDNPWANQEKFINGKGGGTKQIFDKPTSKKRK